MNQKVFCEECRDDVEYTVTSVPMIGTIKGREYSYTGMETRCVDCGSLVYVPEISDNNLEALYRVFRETNGIVPLKPKTIVRHGAYGKIDFFCPSCMQLLGKHYKVCPKCGQELKWKHESTQKT